MISTNWSTSGLVRQHGNKMFQRILSTRQEFFEILIILTFTQKGDWPRWVSTVERCLALTPVTTPPVVPIPAPVRGMFRFLWWRELATLCTVFSFGAPSFPPHPLLISASSGSRYIFKGRENMDRAYSYEVSISRKTRNCLGLRHFDCLLEEKMHKHNDYRADSPCCFFLGAFAKLRKSYY